MILHGLFGSSDNWRSIGKALAQKYRVTLVDLRNHGKSPHSDIFSLETMALDIKELLEALQEPAILLGHSMGGKVAMELALTWPTLLQALVILDVAPKPYDMPKRFQAIIEALVALPLSTLADLKSADHFLAQTIPELSMRAFLLKNLSFQDGTYHWKMNLTSIAGQLQNIGLPPQTTGRFAKPALFLYGELSDYVLPEDLPLISQLFPKSEIQKIPEAGHWLHVDQPVSFIRQLTAFLSALEGK